MQGCTPVSKAALVAAARHQETEQDSILFFF